MAANCARILTGILVFTVTVSHVLAKRLCSARLVCAQKERNICQGEALTSVPFTERYISSRSAC